MDILDRHKFHYIASYFRNIPTFVPNYLFMTAAPRRCRGRLHTVRLMYLSSASATAGKGNSTRSGRRRAMPQSRRFICSRASGLANRQSGRGARFDVVRSARSDDPGPAGTGNPGMSIHEEHAFMSDMTLWGFDGSTYVRTVK